MEQTFLTIECKSNLHVGSGKANYGVIDQLVQRDATYQYPTIHASSLKGAIKEHCHHLPFGSMKHVFGSEKGSSDTQVGQYKFFDAMLLCIPVRCDKRAFVHITCPNILKFLRDSLPLDNVIRKNLNDLSNIFSSENNTDAYCFTESLDNATVEDFDIESSFVSEKQNLFTDELKLLFKYDIVILKNELFDRLTNDLHLPVIARNYLQNGESKNLWYEQVVPRLSRFWSRTIHPKVEQQDEDNKDKDLFNGVLFKDNTIVQIGANGSVGYGYSSFSKIQ